MFRFIRYPEQSENRNVYTEIGAKRTRRLAVSFCIRPFRFLKGWGCSNVNARFAPARQRSVKMATNILAAPVAKLQSELKTPAPWGFVARHLVSLIKSYSTGLPFEVAAHEVSVAWKKHCKTAQSCPRVLTGTITHVAYGSPEVWLVRLEDATEVAVYAHCNYSGTVAPASVVSFAAANVLEPRSAQGAVPEHVRMVRYALRKASTGSDGETNGVQTPTKNVEETNSQSPVDVMKFASRKGQPQNAATPSQVVDPADPGGSVTRVVLPTPNIFFDLESISPAALGLKEPPRAFSLQRVWNERTLTPSWIYAAVVDVEREEDCIVRFQDLPTDDVADQPSVLWRVPRELDGVIGVLKPGFHVLLRNPLVQPTGESFEVLCAPHTTCYYVAKSTTKRLVTLLRPVLQEITNTGPRAVKRQRVDQDLSQSTTVVDMKQVEDLANPESQPEFVTHARVTGAPKKEDSYLTAVPCQHGVVVRVVGQKMARRAAQCTVGDEILLQGMIWAMPSNSSGGPEPTGWIAGSIDNLSSMTGVLWSPLVRHIVSLRDVALLGAKATSSTTAHVLVRIQNAIPNSESRELLLSVTDCRDGGSSSPTHLLVPDILGHGEIENTGHPGKQTRESDRAWDVKVRDTCFESLFWSQMNKSFWDDESMALLVDCLPRLRAGQWLMTLTCHPTEESPLPEVCACVSYND